MTKHFCHDSSRAKLRTNVDLIPGHSRVIDELSAQNCLNFFIAMHQKIPQKKCSSSTQACLCIRNVLEELQQLLHVRLSPTVTTVGVFIFSSFRRPPCMRRRTSLARCGIFHVHSQGDESEKVFWELWKCTAGFMSLGPPKVWRSF